MEQDFPSKPVGSCACERIDLLRFYDSFAYLTLNSLCLFRMISFDSLEIGAVYFEFEKRLRIKKWLQQLLSLSITRLSVWE